MTDTMNPVRLVALAAELGVEPDVVERELGADVFRSGGFRVCSAARAAELIERHETRRAEAEARTARRRAAAAARAKDLRQAGIERGRAAREAASRGESQIVPMRVSGLTEVQSSADLLPVQAMTAASDKRFEGGAYTPRPSRLDWMLGGEGGATIGPSASEIRREAAARKARKEGSK
jgi:hypothetical protein